MPEIARKSVTPKQKRFVLKLYVTGATRTSQRAIQNLKQICEEYLSGGYDLEVVDVYKTPEIARAAEILASPTLVKEVPAPVRRLTGDLSQQDRVLLLLGLKGK